MARITYLTLSDFEIICQELKHFFKKNNDPIPVFEQTYFDKLEMVIASPARTFDKKDLYPYLFQKAACYFYFINKLHPFNNGNKRISIVSTDVFLMSNGYEFIANNEDMYTFATSVTLNHTNQKKDFGEVADFIEKNSRKSSRFSSPKFIRELLRILRRR